MYPNDEIHLNFRSKLTFPESGVYMTFDVFMPNWNTAFEFQGSVLVEFSLKFQDNNIILFIFNLDHRFFNNNEILRKENDVKNMEFISLKYLPVGKDQQKNYFQSFERNIQNYHWNLFFEI